MQQLPQTSGRSIAVTDHKPKDSGYAETKPTQPMTDKSRPDPRKPGGEAAQTGKEPERSQRDLEGASRR